MAKASSPIRLQNDLMVDAKLTGDRFHRSAAEQIEYWASLGRSIYKLIDPDTLISITAGLAQITVAPVITPRITTKDVFDNIESMRMEKVLSGKVANTNIVYQASESHPGLLERIDAEGKINVGRFTNGEFVHVNTK